MRILSGKLKGMLIKGQKEGLRPTTSIAKISIFNILDDRIIDSVFADCFAGTGGMGFEAYSRGAKEILFVENNADAVRFLKENSERLKVNAQIYKRDVFDFLSSRMEKKIDILFFSPPFDTIHWHSLLRSIENSPLLHPEILVIIQHPKVVGLESLTLQKIDERRYGFNKFSFFEPKRG